MTDRARDGNRPRPAAAGPDSRLSLLRELGEQAVLETIFRKGPITRPQISTATSLSKPTVSAAVSRLEHAGLVHAAGRRTGQRGRKPVAYVVSPQAGFVVGGDIGGSNVRVAASDLFGEPICDLKRATVKDGSRAVGVQILEMVSEVIDAAAATHGRPLALGISVAGRGRPAQRQGHLARLQRGPRGRLRSTRGDPGPLRPAGAGREQRQPRRGGREVVRARARGLDARVHRDRRGHRHGRHHRRRARARRPRSRGRDRISAAGRRSVQPPPSAARRARGRGRSSGHRRGLQRAAGRRTTPRWTRP